MKFNACPPECKGPFADLAASRAKPHRATNYEARDEQRFQSAIERLNDGSQQPAIPASQMPSFAHAPKKTWPPPKPRDRGVTEPRPSTTRAPGSSTSFSYPAAYSNHAPSHFRDGPSTEGPASRGPPSRGLLAPGSWSGTKRVSST